MKTFNIGVTLTIEAETEDEAIREFYEKMNECEFVRKQLEIEEKSNEQC